MAGFVAGEGTFTRWENSFGFAVKLGAIDAVTCDRMREFFGAGTVHHYARRRAHYDDEVVFQVRRTRDLVEVVVPFMDEHLPACHKRRQFEEWRAALFDYWENRFPRPRTCTVDGCDASHRAHGVCRHHLYELYGT